MTKEDKDMKEAVAINDADRFGRATVDSIADNNMRLIVDDFRHRCMTGEVFTFGDIQRIGLRFYGNGGEIERDEKHHIRLVRTLESIADKYEQVRRYVEWLRSESYEEDIKEDEIFASESEDRMMELELKEEARKAQRG